MMKHSVAKTVLAIISMVLLFTSCDLDYDIKYGYSTTSVSAGQVRITVTDLKEQTSISFPPSVDVDGTKCTVVGFDGFSSPEVAAGVQSVTFPISVVSIASDAFAGAYNLTEVCISPQQEGRYWNIILGCTIPKDGYVFDGWYSGNHRIVPTDSISVYRSIAPRWTEATIPQGPFSVTLVANGGTIAAGKDVTSYELGTGATLPVRADMTKSGVHFAGWYASSDFSGSAVTAISTTDNGDKTYYAKWEAHSFTRSGELATEVHTCSVCGESHDAVWQQGVCQEGSHSIATCTVTGCDIIVNEESTGTVIIEGGSVSLNIELKDAPCGEMEIVKVDGQNKWTIAFKPHENSEAVVFASCFVDRVALEADQNMVFTYEPTSIGRHRYSFSVVSKNGQAIEKTGYIEIKTI